MTQIDGRSAVLMALKAKQKEILAAAKEARSAKSDREDVEDGVYVAQIKKAVMSLQRKAPVMRFQLLITRGPRKGTSLFKAFDLVSNNPDLVSTVDLQSRLFATLSLLGETDASKIDVGDVESFLTGLEAVCESLSTSKPEVQIQVKHSSSGYLQVFINRVVTDKAPEASTNGDDSGSDGDTDDTDGSDDLDSGWDGTVDEQPIEIKDQVKFVPAGATKAVTGAVTASDPRTKICKVKDTTGKVHKLSWDDVKPIYV